MNLRCLGPLGVRCVTLLGVLSLVPLAAAQDEKAPVPGSAARKAAEKEIRKTLAAEYAATEPSEKRALAEKLLEQGKATPENSAVRYVLLYEAGMVGAQALSLHTSFKSIALMTSLFDVNEEDLTDQAIRAARKFARTPDHARVLAADILARADRLRSEGRYDFAIDIVKDGQRLARSARDPALVAAYQTLSKDLPELKKEYERFTETDLSGAIDLGAHDKNREVGHYLCFAKADWSRGPEFLQWTGDKALTEAAKGELNPPTDASGRTKLAENWLALAKKERKALTKRRYTERAVFWYREALQTAAGFEKTKIEKTLSSLGTAANAGTVKVTYKGSIEIVPLKDGMRFLLNRAYSIPQIPLELRGLYFTKLNGNAKIDTTIHVGPGARVYLLLDPEEGTAPLHAELPSKGWEKRPDLPVVDVRMKRFIVYRRTFARSETITFPGVGFTGVCVAASSLTLQK